MVDDRAEFCSHTSVAADPIEPMASKANGKQPHADGSPSSALPAAPAVTWEEGANETAAGGGAATERGSSSGVSPHSKELLQQQHTEGRRLRAGSKEHVGLGIGDFAVMGKLGEGGYGTVLLARHKTTHLMYALKMQLKARIQSDIQAERVLSEAQALNEVQLSP